MDKIKQNLGASAAELVLDNQIVALGTGTTAESFIYELAKRCERGLKIKTVSSSIKSYELAKRLNLKQISENEINDIDIYIDGADEVDEKKNLIKGRGGALLREKILASFSRKVIIMIDHTKLVQKLGRVLLPVEVASFGVNITKKKLEKLGYKSSLRDKKTENGNYILDIKLPYLLEDPKDHHDTIKSIPGVFETGLFFKLPSTILVGYPDNKIEIMA